MKIKTSEATGLQLDWGLALAVGGNPEIQRGKVYVPFAFMEGAALKLYRHTDPAVCMGLMQDIQIAQQASNESWRVGASHGVVIEGCVSTKHCSIVGATLAEAVARCVIAMRLGDEFECPSELCQIECWSCGHTMTMEQRSTNDGHCVKCNAEIEMPDELGVQS